MKLLSTVTLLIAMSLCAACSAGQEDDLTKQQVEKAVKAVHDNEPLQVELMTEYDNYYVDTEGKMVLPVWKVKVENADHTVYYVNPKTAGTGVQPVYRPRKRTWFP